MGGACVYRESERVRERERDSKRGTQCIFLFPSRSGLRGEELD